MWQYWTIGVRELSLSTAYAFYALTNSFHRQSPSEYKIPERFLKTFYEKECC